MAAAFALLAFTARGAAAVGTPAIKVDQTGYLTQAPKLAMVAGEAAAGAFMVRRAKDSSVVFRGTLSASVHDRDTGDAVQTADFTALTAPGEYYLDIPGLGRSWGFRIGGDVYSRAFYLAMRSYYGQRCGTAVDLGPEFPGIQTRCLSSAGRLAPLVRARPARANRPKAGTTPAIMADMSSIPASPPAPCSGRYEIYTPRLREIRLNIPESGNSTPDILNEIRWNLDWMLNHAGRRRRRLAQADQRAFLRRSSCPRPIS